MASTGADNATVVDLSEVRGDKARDVEARDERIDPAGPRVETPKSAQPSLRRRGSTSVPSTEVSPLVDDGTAASRRFRDFIVATSDWVWETDENGILVFLSDRITEILGRPASTIRNISIFDFGGVPDDEQAESVFDSMRAHRPFRGTPFEITDAKGVGHRCELSGVPVFDTDTGRFCGYRGTGTDVSARFDAEREARRYRQRLEHAVEEIHNKNVCLEIALGDANAATRAKAEFLAVVSHELRTPLNAIIGFTEIMDREMFGPIGSDRYRDYLKNIGDSAQHLLGIIGDILEMSKIDAGKLDLTETPLDIRRLTELCWRLLEDRAKESGVDFTMRFPPHMPALQADERLVKQMLLNLLSNSIKFTPRGGSIAVSAELRDDGSMAILVSDTGIGIDPEDFDTVLTPFGQVENAYSRTREGTGLGLPLVKSMVETHGGRLEIDSKAGDGTAITLVFPAGRVLQETAT